MSKKSNDNIEEGKLVITKTDNGVVIETGSINIYGIRVNGIKLNFKNDKFYQHTIVNRQLEEKTLELLKMECNDADVIYAQESNEQNSEDIDKENDKKNKKNNRRNDNE